MVTPYLSFLLLLGAERLVELGLSRRNATWASERGGIEVGRGHFRALAALHVLFLVGCGVEVVILNRPFVPALGIPMLAVVVAAQGLRYWAIASLGRYWNVRVIVVPGAPAVATGPYRFVRHPNYLAVILEGFAIPLVHSAWLTAVAFSLCNAILLAVRIRCEEKALAAYCDYDRRLAGRLRFRPQWAGRYRA